MQAAREPSLPLPPGKVDSAGDPSRASLQPLPFLPVLGPGDAVELGIDFYALSDEAVMLVQNDSQENNQKQSVSKGEPSIVPSTFAHMGMSRLPELGSLGYKLYI